MKFMVKKFMKIKLCVSRNYIWKIPFEVIHLNLAQNTVCRWNSRIKSVLFENGDQTKCIMDGRCKWCLHFVLLTHLLVTTQPHNACRCISPIIAHDDACHLLRLPMWKYEMNEMKKNRALIQSWYSPNFSRQWWIRNPKLSVAWDP